MEEQLKQLQERFDRAEREGRTMRRQSRIWRWMTLAMLMVGVAVVATRPTATLVQGEQLLTGQPGFQVKAPLTVVDEAGQPILLVDANSMGRGLILFDQSGKMLCGIGTTPQSRGLVIFDAQEKLIGGLGEGNAPDGTAMGRGLTIFDASEKVLAGLGVGTNDSFTGRGLAINDETGRQVLGAGVFPPRPDRGQLVIADRDGDILFAQPLLP